MTWTICDAGIVATGFSFCRGTWYKLNSGSVEVLPTGPKGRWFNRPLSLYGAEGVDQSYPPLVLPTQTFRKLRWERRLDLDRLDPDRSHELLRRRDDHVGLQTSINRPTNLILHLTKYLGHLARIVCI